MSDQSILNDTKVSPLAQIWKHWFFQIYNLKNYT